MFHPVAPYQNNASLGVDGRHFDDAQAAAPSGDDFAAPPGALNEPSQTTDKRQHKGQGGEEAYVGGQFHGAAGATTSLAGVGSFGARCLNFRLKLLLHTLEIIKKGL